MNSVRDKREIQTKSSRSQTVTEVPESEFANMLLTNGVEGGSTGHHYNCEA
jgi:hypothetical protein